MSGDTMANASQVILDFLIANYRNARGVHSETIIGAAAALAADFALRGHEMQLPHEGRVVSQKTNAFLATAKDALWTGIRDRAIEAGAAEEDLSDVSATLAGVTQADDEYQDDVRGRNV